ncbi:MAG: nucleoside triphosphate pyrophosphohydrolase [bacterium]|nr:nucleoside triphosphate pyrophosphohydrolase [bacterium]
MKEFNKLIKILKKLRNPINGCPWDRKQTPDSLKEYVLEEAYEVVEAIEDGSVEKQKEELGDLLLQIVFLSQLHGEKGNFTVKDVTEAINKKLIRRHPHIFGDTTVHTAEDVKRNWEKIKKKENKKTSILSDYPPQMPALAHAKRIAEQASTVGFDWADPLKALEKVEEEIGELKKELQNRRDRHEGHRDRVEEELGDILFAVANVSRLAKVNPEFALKSANKKFVTRFRYIEEQLKKQGKDISETSLDEMEELWQEAKKNEPTEHTEDTEIF